MTELVMKQITFAKYLAKLIETFPTYNITFGEVWRSHETCVIYAREGKGVVYSCHEIRLAADLNILINGKLANQKSDYEPLGIYWKKLPSLFPADIEIETKWGGDFTSLCDFYHFSITHNGIS